MRRDIREDTLKVAAATVFVNGLNEHSKIIWCDYV